jgi:hypothetical protein
MLCTPIIKGSANDPLTALTACLGWQLPDIVDAAKTGGGKLYNTGRLYWVCSVTGGQRKRRSVCTDKHGWIRQENIMPKREAKARISARVPGRGIELIIEHKKNRSTRLLSSC